MREPPHAEEARSAVSKHAIGLSRAGAAIAVIFAGPFAGRAQQAPDLAKYDCALGDQTISGDRLLADGFQIVSVGRFGPTPNVMLVDPKGAKRANCFVRREPGQEGRN